MSIKFSIITINLNNAIGLEKTIKSVINQSYKNIEYIIIDGGSTDSSLEIISSYRDFITICVSEQDKGISDAFNKGIAISTGDFIGIINSGDWYEQDTIDKVYPYNTSDVICGRINMWSENKIIRVRSSNLKYLKNYMSICHPSVFVNRNVYTKIGYFDNKYKIAMDFDFLLRAMISGYKFKAIDVVLANMELEGASYNNENKGIWESFLIKDSYKKKFTNYIELIYYLLKGYLKKFLVKFYLCNKG